MKPVPHSRSLTLALLLGSLALSGCTSITSMSGVADPVDHPSVAGSALHGYVYGGHAPIAGAHVYLLQPGTTGTGSQATSQFNSVTTGAMQNVSDPGVPVGAYYVLTQSDGSFSVANGGYSCLTNGSGSAEAGSYPAILYAYGGSSTPTFVSGTTGAITNSNNAIVQLATLGSCAGIPTLPYIYMNEVSTVATAYAFQGFTPYVPTALTNYATYIGSDNSSQAVTGLVNASLTAAELYSTDGHYTGTASDDDGDDHIANPNTINKNGVVPQAEIDTLANILANCVDAGGATGTGAANSACTGLFALATNTGATLANGGIQATDTATSMIDIARHPSGAASSTFAQSLYDLQPAESGDPFSPYLTSAPNDFTLSILYRAANNNDPATGNDYLDKAESVEVDGVGNVWITAQGYTDAFQWNSQGVLQSNVDSAGYIYGYVSIDGSNNAWTGAANTSQGIEEYNPNGQLIQTYGSGYTDAYTLMTNQAGDAFFIAKTAATTPDYALFEYGPGGATITGSPFNLSASTTTSNSNTGTLTITNATVAETCAGLGCVLGGGKDTYTYTFTATNPGAPAGAIALAAGQTVTLALTDMAAAGRTGAGTNWPSLDGAQMVATANGTTFTVTGTTNLGITNDGQGTGTYTYTTTTTTPGAITAGDNVAHGAIDHDGDLWLTTESSYQIARVGTAAGTQGNTAFTSITVPQQPEFVAINNAGNAVIPIQSGDSASGTAAANIVPGAYVVTPGGAATALYSGTSTDCGAKCPAPSATVVYTGANFVSAFGAAIDGNNNIWIANRCLLFSSGATATENLCPTGPNPNVPVGADSITELNGSTYAAISPPTTNYQPSTGVTTSAPTTILSDSLNLAIDPSGNIWITNYYGSEIVEMVGAAAPVVTPLSVAAANNTFGTTP